MTVHRLEVSLAESGNGAVRLGEDNRYLYRELLGYTPEEYAIWEEEGHIGMDYHPDVR